MQFYLMYFLAHQKIYEPRKSIQLKSSLKTKLKLEPRFARKYFHLSVNTWVDARNTFSGTAFDYVAEGKGINLNLWNVGVWPDCVK